MIDIAQQQDVEPKALVVDDDQRTARAISRSLSVGGFNVTIVTDPANGLVKVLTDSFDVIFSDILMPGMDGLQLIQAVRAFDLDVPIILITGVPSRKSAQRAVNFGAYRYLTKPFDADDLVAVAREATYVHQLSRLKRQAYKLAGSADRRPGDLAGRSDALNMALASLRLDYQPIVQAESGEIFGFEAFLRSEEPRLPSPEAIIEAAQTLGRAHDIGRSVRKLAAESLSRMDEDVVLFINLLADDLLDENLGSTTEPLTQIGDRVILEFNERELLSQGYAVINKLSMLHDHGFRIAVDDFGSGQAGSSNFARLKPDIVKIDKNLISEIDASRDMERVVQSMVEVCHVLNIQVIAEGVETSPVKETCVRVGFDMLQGYLFARPDSPFPTVNLK